jgi:hypothetical protein
MSYFITLVFILYLRGTYNKKCVTIFFEIYHTLHLVYANGEEIANEIHNARIAGGTIAQWGEFPAAVTQFFHINKFIIKLTSAVHYRYK